MTSPKIEGPVAAGETAPDFTLKYHQAGKVGEVSLKDYRGKKNVILAFYPKDDTPGCTKEMCAFSEDISQFAEAQTELLGISCDNLERHEKFSGKYNLKQILLADEGGNVGRAYGTVQEGRANASRVLFIIDKAGVVRHVIEGMPKNDELLSLVVNLTKAG